ncbi:hypothetical protein BC835DRAFT_1415708 [Cytidiella melzeri]|nr:hypothetical protein BC835DRAFT_1415708 [Cytidiella melzeri]
MSTVDIRVELPAYSHSFQIQVDRRASIKDVKSEIQRTCRGSPQVSGQRLIWRGRLLNDAEIVEGVWKSANDPRVVHLSVHPSAWTGAPPTHLRDFPTIAPHTAQQPLLSAPIPQRFQRRDLATPAAPSPLHPVPVHPTPLPLEFIHNKHNTALYVLINGTLPTLDTQMVPRVNSATRAHAQRVLEMHGYSWPSVLDEEYPPPSAASQGVKYEHVTIYGATCLSLTTPDKTPSPIQQHALKVLRSTFSLLELSAPDPTIYQPLPQFNPQVQMPATNLNQHLHQLGFPALRVAPGQNANQNPPDPNNFVPLEVRAIPLRALMVPLMMLLFRTCILVYFFSPSKRPLFGLILSAYIFYEAWGALRGVLGGDRLNNDDAAGEQQGRADNGAAAGEQPQQAPGQDVAAGNNNANNANNHNNNRNQQPTGRSLGEKIVNIIAHCHLSHEEAVLNDGHRYRPSTFTVKARIFVFLFVATLHPAVWDRRRSLLKKREGRLRTEANMRQSSEADEATEPERFRSRQQIVDRHQRRPSWVQAYVERVLNTEWADDA